MMFGKRLTRALSIGVVAGAVFMTTANAQNENNWHSLSNGFDGTYGALGFGLGGGGLATNADGRGIWVYGEDVHGSTPRASDGDYSYKTIQFGEVVCYFTPSGSGPADWNPNWTFYEADGGNEAAPWVFSLPTCVGVGLTSTATFAPYLSPATSTGVGVGTASFIVAGIPSGIGTGTFAAPNNGLLPSSDGGTLTSQGTFFLGGTVGVPTGCLAWTIGAAGTVAAYSDNIDGLYHWIYNNAGGGSTLNATYYGFSFNELATTNSNSLITTGNGSALTVFPATTALAWQQGTLEANTSAILAPNMSDPFGGGAPLSTYYSTTLNGNAGIGGSTYLDLNGGFDTASTRTISLGFNAPASLTPGYADGNDSLAGTLPFVDIFAAQDPTTFGAAGGGGFLNTLGFASWSTRDYSGGSGSPGDERVTWIAFAWDTFFGADPSAQVNVVPNPFTLTRVPSVNNKLAPSGPDDFLQALGDNLLPTFTHTTLNDPLYPDPEGFGQGGAADPHVAGQSTQLPTGLAVVPAVCVGLPISLSYGTTVFSTLFGDFDWNPATGSPSGRKHLYIFD